MPGPYIYTHARAHLHTHNTQADKRTNGWIDELIKDRDIVCRKRKRSTTNRQIGRQADGQTHRPT